MVSVMRQERELSWPNVQEMRIAHQTSVTMVYAEEAMELASPTFETIQIAGEDNVLSLMLVSTLMVTVIY